MQFEIKNPYSPIKRTAACTPKGSMTVEASLVIPIFLFAVLSLIYLLEIHSIQTTIRMAAHTAAKEVAQQMAVLPEIETGLFQSNLIRAAGADRLNRSIIVGGSNGIRCWNTQINSLDQVEVCIEYEMQLPFPEIVVSPISCKEEFKVKCWTGYQTAGSQTGEGENDIVYITEQGEVYHSDCECSYLKLSIQFVPADALTLKRNRNGEKYYACDACVSVSSLGGYYITDYGDRYHSSLGCSGLKRTVYAVTQAEAEGREGCSKCTK